MTIAYVDECGRGPLWGPVYAASVIWDDTKEINPPFPVKSWDSKRFPKKKKNSIRIHKVKCHRVLGWYM